MPTKPRSRRKLTKRSYSALADAFLACRTFGHTWEDVSGVLDGLPPSDEPTGVRVALRCTRCPTVRYDTVSVINGYVLSRGYIYPEGYALAAYDGRFTLRQELRLEYVTRHSANGRRK